MFLPVSYHQRHSWIWNYTIDANSIFCTVVWKPSKVELPTPTRRIVQSFGSLQRSRLFQHISSVIYTWIWSSYRIQLIFKKTKDWFRWVDNLLIASRSLEMSKGCQFSTMSFIWDVNRTIWVGYCLWAVELQHLDAIDLIIRRYHSYGISITYHSTRSTDDNFMMITRKFYKLFLACFFGTRVTKTITVKPIGFMQLSHF